MRILLTGGTGHVGRAAAARLVADGHDVLVVGRRSGVEIPGARYAVCDVTDAEALRPLAAGRDAVVHLAAIPSPGGAPSTEVLRVNVQGTINVFDAAAAAGIRRVVQASSINAFGCTYAVHEIAHVRYFPIDEAHPTHTTDPYSFSKELIESVGRYYWRRDGISSVALRLPWVHPAGHVDSERFAGHLRRTHAVLDELLAMPAEARRERLAAARQKAAAIRRQRLAEFDARRRGEGRPRLDDDPLTYMWFNDRANFWTFVDERDSAQAIAKALTADYDGSEALFINDTHNWVLHDTEKLLGLFWPEVTARTRPLLGAACPVSIDRARALIGFEPEFSVAAAASGVS